MAGRKIAIYGSTLPNNNCIELARFVADTTLNTFILIQYVGFLFLTGYSLLGTFEGAQTAAITGLVVYFVMKKGLADPCRAFFIPDMGLVLITEISNGCEHGVGGRGA